MSARRYAVIGTGAIGGLYGGRLVAAGFDVAFLGRSDVPVLRRDGLTVNSPWGDLALKTVRAETDPAMIGPVDVVLVTIKTTGQAALAELLPPLVRPGTIVVLMQNGFGLEAEIAAIVPDAIVLGAMCFVCATRTEPGRIDHIDYGGVTVAEHTADGSAAGRTEAVGAIIDDFTAAEIEVTARDDLLAARWQKLVWNMPFNGLSVVLDAGTDEMMGDERLREVVRSLMIEVANVAEAHGHPVGGHFVDKMISTTDAMTPYAPSMKLDYDAQRPLELAAIYDAPLSVAASLGVATPGLSMLAAQLHLLDATNRG